MVGLDMLLHGLRTYFSVKASYKTFPFSDLSILGIYRRRRSSN